MVAMHILHPFGLIAHVLKNEHGRCNIPMNAKDMGYSVRLKMQDHIGLQMGLNSGGL